MVWDKLLCFDWLMSPKRPTQRISRRTSRQSWCISSDSVVYPIERGKVVAPENLYKDLLNFVLYQECVIELAKKYFFMQSTPAYSTAKLSTIYHCCKVCVWFYCRKKSIFLCPQKLSFKNIHSIKISKKKHAFTKKRNCD